MHELILTVTIKVEFQSRLPCNNRKRAKKICEILYDIYRISGKASMNERSVFKSCRIYMFRFYISQFTDKFISRILVLILFSESVIIKQNKLTHLSFDMLSNRQPYSPEKKKEKVLSVLSKILLYKKLKKIQSIYSFCKTEP